MFIQLTFWVLTVPSECRNLARSRNGSSAYVAVWPVGEDWHLTDTSEGTARQLSRGYQKRIEPSSK